MKKILTRVLALALVLLTMFAVCSEAFAAKVSSVSKTVGVNGDHKYTFYVKTGKSLLPRTIKMTMTKGEIEATCGYTWTKDVYDYYYVRISYWDADDKEWVVESSSDKRGTDSRTYTLKKKNTYYKIYVDTWTPRKVLIKYIDAGTLNWPSSIWGMGTYAANFENFTYRWNADKLPKWTIKNGNDCTLYTHNPVQ